MADLIKLTKLAELRDSSDKAIDAEVDRLVKDGVNYGEIAKILVVSSQAVRQRQLRRQHDR